MDSVRKRVRRVYRKIKNTYRLHLIIGNPNTAESWAKLQMCLKEDLQRTKKTINPANVSLDMDAAKAYLVIDISKIIEKMGHLIE
jgi:hypothetical protein